MSTTKRKFKVTKSTRFWFAIIAFFVNSIVFCLGLYFTLDPIALGTGLALINTPVYGYIFGRTVRPATVITKETPDGKDA